MRREEDQSEFLKEMLAPEIPVHRILPTIRGHGDGKKTYHIEVWKQYRKHNSFYRSNDKQRKYCVDVPDEPTMHKLAQDLAKLLEETTGAQIIITQTYEEFVLHSKPKKMSAGHYIYRGYTVYDISYESKRWVVLNGEHHIEYYDMKKKKEPSSTFHQKVFTTLGFCLEHLDIHIDGGVKPQ